MNVSVLHDTESFAALKAGWPSLWSAADASIFESYPFVAACWDAVGGQGECWLVTAREGDVLHGVWPLWLSRARRTGVQSAELRGFGDCGLGAGMVAPLCRSGQEEAVGVAFAEALAASKGWDGLEATLGAGKSRLQAALESALVAQGLSPRVTASSGPGCVVLPSEAEWESFVSTRLMAARFFTGSYQVKPGDAAIADVESFFAAAKSVLHPGLATDAVRFVLRLLVAFAGRDDLHVGLLRSVEGQASRLVGIDVALLDRTHRRLHQLVRLHDAAEPERDDELLVASLHAAVRHGMREFHLPAADARCQSVVDRTSTLSAWNETAVGRIRRGISSVKELVAQGDNVDSALRAIDRLRSATPEKVGRAVRKVARYAVFHLYRGELFARDLRLPPEIAIGQFSHADFAALPDGGKDFCAALELDRAYCEQKWERGDLVALARIAGEPVGITWCARSSVFVPDLGRQVKPPFGECYIHDVYVRPEVRGRQVAPAMLDYLARTLRAVDVYRAWALIERSNAASTRAFEKASYASVADVIYARMGSASRLIVRPPDADAKGLLGL